jgi:hypothetical protein
MERKIHNYEIHSLYSSLKMMRAAKTKEDKKSRTCSTHRGAKHLIQKFIENPQRKKTLWRCGRMIILKLVLDKYGGKIYNLKSTRFR